MNYLRTWRGAVTFLLAFIVLITFAIEVGFDALYGNRHGDGLWYHIPRVIFWSKQHNFEPWVTPVAAQIGLPVGADLVLAHKILLGGGWFGLGFVTFILTIGAMACVYIAALDLRFSRYSAALSAVFFASFPAIGLRIWSVNSDIAATFPVLASYVALTRISDTRIGLSVFILLNGVAFACKPTIAPLALLLAIITLWRCRNKLLSLKSILLPCLSVICATCLVVASYWPVYMAFSDFFGGQYSHSHRSTNLREFVHAVAMHFGHWVLEPLGYFARFKEDWQIEAVNSFYNLLGANFEHLPDMWKPYPGQDLGYTGLASVMAFPFLLLGLPRKKAICVALLFAVAFIPLSGMINPQPFFVRYNLVLLAGFAMLWCGARAFSRGGGRWFLLGIVGVNVLALLGVVIINVYLDRTKWSEPQGLYFYISNEDKEVIANSLDGKPLLVLTEGELESLLLTPEISYSLSYVICPEDGNWEKQIESLPEKSNWLAIDHNRKKKITPGPVFERPGLHSCNDVSIHKLKSLLSEAGWAQYKSYHLVELWRFETAK